MDKRAKLIKELENFFDVDAAEKGSTLYMFADYIMARDKKNAEPLVKGLALCKYEDIVVYDEIMSRAIRATLTNLGVESKERV